MAKITLDRLREGMIVATDIRDVNGRVLVSAGEVLTQQRLFNMRACGVQEVEVKVDSLPADDTAVNAAFSASTLERASSDVAEIFRFANTEEPMMQELQRLCVLRRACKLQGGV
jgi:hypothetical protein